MSVYSPLLSHLTLLATVALLPHALPSLAQPPSTAKFEVASIRPSDPSQRGVNIQMLPGGGFRASNVNLRHLVAMAYDVQNFQISGGPGWVNDKTFDVTAKSPGAPPPQSGLPGPEAQKVFRERLQNLLADRFQLVLRREAREANVYALVAGKSGPKLVAAAAERHGVNAGESALTGSGVNMAVLANLLSRRVGRPVIDRTGLEGGYDFKLEWAPEDRPGAPGKDALGGGSAPASGPSIFNALQEQLGLKLEAQKAEIDHLVIVSVSEPTEN